MVIRTAQLNRVVGLRYNMFAFRRFVLSTPVCLTHFTASPNSSSSRSSTAITSAENLFLHHKCHRFELWNCSSALLPVFEKTLPLIECIFSVTNSLSVCKMSLYSVLVSALNDEIWHLFYNDHNFACHQTWAILIYSYSCRASPPTGMYSLRLHTEKWPGWVDMQAGYIPRLYTFPAPGVEPGVTDTVTHPSTNRAQWNYIAALPLNQAFDALISSFVR